MVSYGGSLWVIGGSDGSQNKNDVWRSVDGENWVSVTVSGEHFSGRIGHQVVAQEDLPFVYQRVAVVATAPSRALTVAVGGGETAPVTVAMITASGGSGGLRFEVAGDDAGVATVGGDGEVVVTNLLASGEGATVSVVVRDSTPVNSAEVAVTVAFCRAAVVCFVGDGVCGVAGLCGGWCIRWR